jgi:hypothetical protein
MAPQERGRSRGAVLSMVAAVMMATLCLSGCLSSPTTQEEPKITIILESPFAEGRQGTTDQVWDATLDIMRILPTESEVPWSGLRVLVKSETGSVLLVATEPVADSGTYGDAVEVWYVDTTGNRDRADAGDAFKVTSMSEDYEGATVEVLRVGERVASTRLQTDFP